MTRDEAIEIEFQSAKQWAAFSPVPDIDIRLAAAQTIDCYVNLGMLKLDKPKNRMTVFCEQMQWAEGGPMYQELFRALEKAGLTISEK